MTKQSLQVWSGPFPQAADDLVKRNPRSLQQRVDHMVLNGAYPAMLPFMEATENEDAVEGKLIFDRACCATALRSHAEEQGDEIISALDLSTLDRMIRSTMNRNKIGRTQRRKALQLSLLVTEEQPPVTDPVTDNG
jgi:hypothetical protein